MLYRSSNKWDGWASQSGGRAPSQPMTEAFSDDVFVVALFAQNGVSELLSILVYVHVVQHLQ